MRVPPYVVCTTVKRSDEATEHRVAGLRRFALVALGRVGWLGWTDFHTEPGRTHKRAAKMA